MKFDSRMEDQIDGLFAEFDRPWSPGYAVGLVHNGELIYGKGFGQATLEHPSPITSQTVFDVGSMAKQFTGMAVALLEEDGLLSLDDAVCKYLARLSGYAQAVTVRDLVYHTSGMRNYTVLAHYMIGYHESDAATTEEILDLLVRQTSLSFMPGTRWEYCDSNYFLLARIVEIITDETLGEYAQSAIFSPLSMDHTQFRENHSLPIRNRALSYVKHDVRFRGPSSYRHATPASERYHTLVSNYEHTGAEGLFTTLEDLCAWSTNFAHNRLGKASPSLMQRVLAPGHLRDGSTVDYGFGLNVGDLNGEPFFGHSGAIHGYTSSLRCFPARDLAIICLANHGAVGAWVYRDRIAELLLPDLYGEAQVSRRPADLLSDEESATVVGAYQNPVTASIWEISCEEGVATVTVNRDWGFRLVPRGDMAFGATAPAADLRLSFLLNDGGRPALVRAHQGGESFTMEPFLTVPLITDDLREYAGEYRSEELQTTFVVDPVPGGLRLENRNRHFCSMDLIYRPAIRDSFIAYDPHPVSSQISFLRENGTVTAFVYRDYDGDNREDLRFHRQG